MCSLVRFFSAAFGRRALAGGAAGARSAFILGLGFLLAAAGVPAAPADEPWRELKGNHFIIRYAPGIGAGWAETVLNRAERYYDSVARQIGFTRYRDFWTWESRVPVYIYADHPSFLEATGLPEWSKGVSVRDGRAVTARAVVSYQQEAEFLDGVLPHEISHLILRDYIGPDRFIPVWFNEGVAQLQEAGKADYARRVMPALVARGRHLPFSWFLRYDIRVETDPETVSVFYLQSVSVVHFLARQYGDFKFHELCSALREGGSFEDSLARVYYPEIRSLDDFEKKWLSYMKFF
jgi:hypothetical protein